MSPDSSLLSSFVGALEGAISVVITLYTGYLIAIRGWLDRSTVKDISKISTDLFLPCLIFVQMGPHLTTDNLSELWIIPVWGLVSTLAAHLIGWFGQRLFKLPYWTIVAAGRPNANALPLLLLQSLQYTSVFDELAAPGESITDTLERGKSYILLNVVIQQSFTYQIAPPLLKLDKPKRNAGRRDEENGRSNLAPESNQPLPSIVQNREHVGLLHDADGRSYGSTPSRADTDGTLYTTALNPIIDQPDLHWPRRLSYMRKPVQTIISWMSAPLIAGILALIAGLSPPLHEFFYDRHGAVYNSFTQALKNLGDLFIALQTVIVGAQLALVPHMRPGFLPTAVPLAVRFVIMPALALLFVWFTAGKSWYTDDPLLWFVLVLIPSGPSAMLLASLAELVNVSQGPLAGYLAVSYLFSPSIAVICSLAIKVVNIAKSRM